MAGRPFFQGLAVLCAICMMSMIIMDRMRRVNVVLLSVDDKDSQDATFIEALKSALTVRGTIHHKPEVLKPASNNAQPLPECCKGS
jgi:hypothetical protein